ncbi:Uncharacterised protein [Staphylococcus petrasii]|uniref:Uncharacterized protein n=1 Tax=Staphylococcus petrasii TaxID=1276936 RepID=A0A380G1S9_9STAP|nr:hypothetical protein [Staphylococcus petrasii]PNZ30305.1 hypothetical protein CD137_05375 [Staphylococcus petrasii]TGE12529.1 hypothetical protein E2557_05320 [Staphylococcus petrasii]TGE18400.1 hypothetical protein BJR09_03275 [Staphylococcus petrasii]SUM44436.1 Uncharacterised protein [Staphylococcus petrasii]
MVEEKYVGTKAFEEFKEHVDSRFNHLDQISKETIDSNYENLNWTIQNMALQFKEEIHKSYMNEICFIIVTSLSIIALILPIVLFTI